VERRAGKYAREWGRGCGRRSSVLVLVCLAILAQALPSSAFAAGGSERQTQSAPGVYVYKAKAIGKFLEEQGYAHDRHSCYRCVVRRNGEGTSLYFWVPREKPPSTVLVVSSRSSVRKLSLPSGIEVEAMNDKGELVVWGDPAKHGWVFPSGAVLKWPPSLEFTEFGVDPGGRYYFLTTPEGTPPYVSTFSLTTAGRHYSLRTPEGTEVGADDNPTEVLARSKYHAYARPDSRRIYYGNDVIYLFAAVPYHDPGLERYPIVLESYRKTGSGFEPQEEQRIPRPRVPWGGVVFVEDFSPELGKVLLVTYVDCPY